MTGGLRVIARSEVGQAVIDRIMYSDDGRTDWRLFFRERVVADSPYWIEIEYRNRLAKATVSVGQLRDIIVSRFKELGAEIGVDYDVVLL